MAEMFETFNMVLIGCVLIQALGFGYVLKVVIYG